MSASSQLLPPLPERMRPRSLSDYVGQRHLVGEGCVLRKMIESGNLSSFILWGPPGVGKTTLAHIIAQTLDRDFFTLSAVTSGVKEVREVFEKARSNSLFIVSSHTARSSSVRLPSASKKETVSRYLLPVIPSYLSAKCLSKLSITLYNSM